MSEASMDIAWNDDEGYDLSYARVAERYGIDQDYDTARNAIFDRIRAIQGAESELYNRRRQQESRHQAYTVELATHEARVEELGKDLAIQRKHHEVEPTQEYARKIADLHKALDWESGEVARLHALLEEVRALKIEDPDHGPFSAAMKFGSYVDPSRLKSMTLPFLEPRNKGVDFPIDPQGYEKALEALRADPPEQAHLYSEGLFFREGDRQFNEWEQLSQEAFEILVTLTGTPTKVRAFNGRLYLRYNADFLCEVRALSVRTPLRLEQFQIGLLLTRGRERHPIIQDLEVQLPRAFILFNDTVLLRHEFRIRRTGIAAQALPRKKDDDDE